MAVNRKHLKVVDATFRELTEDEWIIAAQPTKSPSRLILSPFVASGGISLSIVILIGMNARSLLPLPSWEHVYPAILALLSTIIILAIVAICVLVQNARKDIQARKDNIAQRRAQRAQQNHLILNSDLEFVN